MTAGPLQPNGPFPKDQQGRSFSSTYYYINNKAGLKLKRNWLGYSKNSNCVYCLPCWLFSSDIPKAQDQCNVSLFSTTGVRDWKHLSERVASHEASRNHANSCVIYEQWRKHGTLEEVIQKDFESERSFWRRVLERILNVTLTLATCNLAFRGSCEKMEFSNKGNFLSIIQLLSKYDPVLEELLQRPGGTVKYLSPKIQNELIQLLAQHVKNDIISDLQNALFFFIDF